MTSHQKIPAVIGIPLAVLAGLVIPVQGRINAALGTRLHDGMAAAVVSFTTGLVVMAVISLVFPRGRQGFKAMGTSLKNRVFPRWFVLAGMVGGLFVLAQGVTVTLIGIALFTVAAVTGQTVSGLWADRAGLGPGGPRPVTTMRLVGAILTLAAVIWAVSGRFASGGNPASWLVPLLLPLMAGFLMSFQQAMNGTQTMHYGTPITATLLNFAAGTVLLLVIWVVKLLLSGPGGPLPGELWYYLGGPLGCIYIAAGAVLVRSLGVLLTGLGTIAGQLLGSLTLDVVMPVPGTLVTLATVLGTLLTLAAMVVATLPWPRGVLSRAGSSTTKGSRAAQ